MQADAYQQLIQYLQQWTTRRRRRDALIWLPRGALAGLLAGALVALAARLRPLLTNQEVAIVIAALALVGFLISGTALLLQRYSIIQQARFGDRQFHLLDRTVTAVEIHHGVIQTTSELAQSQLQDSLGAAGRVNVVQGLPLKLNRQDWLLLLITSTLLATAALLQNPQVSILQNQRAVANTIAKETETLQTLSEEIRQNPDLSQAQQSELLQPVEEALQQLQENNLTQEEAVAVLSEAQADLRQLGNDFSNQDLRDRLQAAGAPLNEQAASQELGNALQNGNLGQAGSAMSRLADNLEQLNAAEQAQLAENLAETAAALQETDAELAEELNAAAKALANQDNEAASAAMQNAAATLQQRNQEIAAAQQAQAAANQIDASRQAVTQAGAASQQNDAAAQAQSSGAQGQESGSQSPQQNGAQPLGQNQDGQSGSSETQSLGAGETPGTGGPQEGGGHTENVFVPDQLDLSGAEGVEVELPVECLGNPELCGPIGEETPTQFGQEGSVVPYTQVFGDYRGAANEALSGDYIPLGLKGFIRDYFSSLEPTGGQ